MLLHAKSIVYLFPHSGFLIAVHVPQHDVTYTEEGLRAVVMACLPHIPELRVPMVVLHYLHNRTELTLANTGNADMFNALCREADKEGSLQDFTDLAIETIRSTPQFESQIECAALEVSYNCETDVIACKEHVVYSGVALRPACARFIDFCSQ